MFEQNVRIKRTTFGELEVGDRFLMHCEDGSLFWEYGGAQDLARLDHVEKVQPRGGESSFDKMNASTVPLGGSGRSWVLKDEHPVLHLKQFSVPEKKFLEEVVERFKKLFTA